MSILPAHATIMMIDDEPDNLTVLNDILQSAGYDTVAFTRGLPAIQAALESPPDVILLDVRMPEMDGLRVCLRFKSERALEKIPVIFISALYNSVDIVAAFDAGGVDYVTKPFHANEVLARIGVQLYLRQLQQQLESQNQNLERLVSERTASLAEACRQLKIWDEAKNDWLNLISHEMRTPMTGILSVADLLVDELPTGSPLQACAEAYAHSRVRMMRLIEDAELLSQIRITPASWAHTPVALQTALEHAIAEALLRDAPASRVPSSSVEANGSIALTDTVPCDEGLLRRALTNLIWAAFCCTAGKDPVQIRTMAAGKTARIILRASAPPLSPEALASFFDVCGQRELRRPAGDLGLSPALARRILNLFHGEALIRNADHGVEIEVSLPLST
ncbi:MAG: hybrid sensor histidine kinase/response regulator [bacterium]